MVANFLGARRHDPRAIRGYLKPCVCGCRKINVNNNSGWSKFSITCQACRREIEANTMEDALVQWNKAYNEKFPEIIDD